VKGKGTGDVTKLRSSRDIICSFTLQTLQLQLGEGKGLDWVRRKGTQGELKVW
jgi:hypothetical protein